MLKNSLFHKVYLLGQLVQIFLGISIDWRHLKNLGQKMDKTFLCGNKNKAADP
jgi:hypothetical protein